MSVVKAFHRRFGAPAPEYPIIPDDDLVRQRMRFIREEYEEVMNDMRLLLVPGNPEFKMSVLAALLKELCDLRYQVEGCAVAFGLDIEGAFKEVHRSNMTKSPPTTPYGKVRKGANYSEADMSRFVPPVIEGTYTECAT